MWRVFKNLRSVRSWTRVTCVVSTQLKYLLVYSVHIGLLLLAAQCYASQPPTVERGLVRNVETLQISRILLQTFYLTALFLYSIPPLFAEVRDYRHPGIGRIRKYGEPLPPPCGQRMSVTILTHQKPFWCFMQHLFKYLINIAQCSFFCSSEH